eukprot:EG_transcript_1309
MSFTKQYLSMRNSSGQSRADGLNRGLSYTFSRERTDGDGEMLDSIYDDDFLPEDAPSQRKGQWRTLHAVFLLTYAGRKMRPSGEFAPLAGHSANFRTEDGYVLKLLTQNEAAVLESLQRERSLRGFAPQFMGCVERDGRTYIKMQDVLLSMAEPNFMDIKMGLRTFAECEVESDKRRMDLLKKALVIQQQNPAVYISDDEKLNGISKYRFMSLRDNASSSATLGFRVQGMMKDGKGFTSKDFSSHRSATMCRALFRSFFERASQEQRQGLLKRLQDLHEVASMSDWFANHEVIGSSLLIGYDTASPSKYGLWMIDFARTEPSPRRLTHTRPWTLGSGEDGYLLGVQALAKLWYDEFRGDIPLNAVDWHYRAEGHDCIVIGYHGLEPALQGKVLRLAKEPAIRRQRDTFTGHPATAYNDFVATMLTDYIGPAADPGQVVYVSPQFLQAIAQQVEGIRPQFRALQAGLDLKSEYQLLLQDSCHIPGVGNAKTVAVELKLKMGYLPAPVDSIHWIKALASRFAMQQFLKLHQGSIEKISNYCPADLFSGDFDRIQNVLYRLLDTPQNNLRVFYEDALLVPQQEGKASSVQSGKGVLDTRLEHLLGASGLPPSLYLCELLAKALIQEGPQGTPPLLSKILNLQRLGLDIEVLWPLVKDGVHELQQIYHVDPLDVNAVAQALSPPHPIHCQSVQQRERRGEYGCELANLQPLYFAARAGRRLEMEAVEERVRNFDAVTETRKFLLSQSLKDASLMVALAEVHEPGTLPLPNIVRGSDGRYWKFEMKLMDLDAKNMQHLEKWYELDRTIVQTYMLHALGAGSIPEEDTPRGARPTATPPRRTSGVSPARSVSPAVRPPAAASP